MNFDPKPLEETWAAIFPYEDPDGGTWEVVLEGTEVLRADVPHESVARLAAAAPEMARLLLEIQWSSRDEGGSTCPSCYAEAYVPPARYDADGKYLGYTEGTHDPDCALAAVLRKAGVLQSTG